MGSTWFYNKSFQECPSTIGSCNHQAWYDFRNVRIWVVIYSWFPGYVLESTCHWGSASGSTLDRTSPNSPEARAARISSGASQILDFSFGRPYIGSIWPGYRGISPKWAFWYYQCHPAPEACQPSVRAALTNMDWAMCWGVCPSCSYQLLDCLCAGNGRVSSRNAWEALLRLYTLAWLTFATGFRPIDVYTSFYDHICTVAVTQIDDAADELLSSIQLDFVDLFFRMEKGRSSAALHADNLLEHLEYLRPLRSPSTCLCCIQRKSEHVFECGHALYDIYVVIFGDTVEGLEYYFEMPICLLCRLGSLLNVRLLPLTCSARLLSVNSGGSRGIVLITFLNTL